MAITGDKGGRWGGTMIVLTAATAPAAALAVAALWFQAPPAFRGFWIAVPLAAAGAIVGVGWRHRRAGWAGLAIALIVGAAWWTSIKPSNDRIWAPDVAYGVTGDIVGDDVVLHNVRNFAWTSDSDFVPRWETRPYALDRLTSVDLVSSVWASPAIAHTLVSFGFADDQTKSLRHVVFSAEVRRERGEEFSEVGGFFKEFELVMIAADENDILRLRTNIRREDVTLLPLRLTPAQRRALFMAYVTRADKLARQPEWYETITTNCTTVIFELARIVDSRIPLDWRILVSGYLPGYLYDLGIIRTDIPLAEVLRQAAISGKAQAMPPSADYSRAIRQGQAPAGTAARDR